MDSQGTITLRPHIFELKTLNPMLRILKSKKQQCLGKEPDLESCISEFNNNNNRIENLSVIVLCPFICFSICFELSNHLADHPFIPPSIIYLPACGDLFSSVFIHILSHSLSHPFVYLLIMLFLCSSVCCWYIHAHTIYLPLLWPVNLLAKLSVHFHLYICTTFCLYFYFLPSSLPISFLTFLPFSHHPSTAVHLVNTYPALTVCSALC